MSHSLLHSLRAPLAVSVLSLSFALVTPAHGQIYLDGQYGSATDSTQAICTDGGAIYANFKNDCEIGLTGGQPISPDGIGFGVSNGFYITYIGADGAAYFGGDLRIDNGVTVNGLLDSYNGIDNAGGLTNRGGLTNHNSLTNSGGLFNTGGITSSGTFSNTGAFTNSGTLHNVGDAIFENNLSVDHISGGSLETRGYIIAGAIITANAGLDVHSSLYVYSGSSVNMNGNRIQNVGTPIAATDAATKGYVDASTNGAAAAAATAQSTANTALANAATAQGTANTALANAATAQGTANTALANAAGAQGTANTALANAAAAQRTADLAVVKEDNEGRDTASALGGGATYDPATGHIIQPNYTVGNASYNSVGAAIGAANSGGLRYFHSNTSQPDGSATGANSLAIGSASAGGAGSLAAGSGAVASAAGAVAIGQGAQATGANAVAIGNGARATGSVAVGVGASAANGGTALGDRSLATGLNSAALGADASATADNAVAIGSASLATVANTVSVGSATNQRRIVNLAPGAAPSDAATVAQLSAGNASVASALGGGAVASPNGTISGPSYALNGTTYNNVGSALVSLSDRLAGVTQLAFDIRKEERRGIAAATAMATAPMPSAPGRTSWATNAAVFHGEVGFGGSLAHRFDTGSDASLAFTAGFAYARGGNSVAKVGMAGEF